MSLNTAHKLLGSTTLPTIKCGKGNILFHRNSLFQPVQEWHQSCRVKLETPIGHGSNSTSLLGQFRHGLLYLRNRHLGWPTFVDTLPNLVVTPSNSFAQILQLPHEPQQFQHGLHNRQIQHRTAFRVQGAKGFVLAGVCFTRAYPSSKPKASTTLSQYCCHVHRWPVYEKTSTTPSFTQIHAGCYGRQTASLIHQSLITKKRQCM